MLIFANQVTKTMARGSKEPRTEEFRLSLVDDKTHRQLWVFRFTRENLFIALLFIQGDHIIRQFIDQVHRARADIQHNVVTVELILMNHSIPPGRFRTQKNAQASPPLPNMKRGLPQNEMQIAAPVQTARRRTGLQ